MSYGLAGIKQDILDGAIGPDKVGKFFFRLRFDGVRISGKPFLKDLENPPGTIGPEAAQIYLKDAWICVVTEYGAVKFRAADVLYYKGIPE